MQGGEGGGEGEGTWRCGHVQGGASAPGGLAGRIYAGGLRCVSTKGAERGTHLEMRQPFFPHSISSPAPLPPQLFLHHDNRFSILPCPLSPQLFLHHENRFSILERSDPETARRLHHDLGAMNGEKQAR